MVRPSASPGLILRVGKRRRTWHFRYHAGGSYHRKPLGYFPAMGLGEAREAARKLIDRADRGVPTDAPAPHPRSADVLTLGGLFDRYEALRKREGKKIKTLDEAMRLLRRNLAPYLSLPADQFSKADLRAARDAMVEADAMIAGNRLLQRLGPVMKWAAQEDLIPANFVPDIRKAPEQKRTRKLTDAEIRAIWHACGDDLGSRAAAKNFGRMVQFLAGDGAAARRGGLASPWPHPRRRVEADREQERAGRTALSCRRWRWSWSGRAARATSCSPAASARSPASRN